MPVLLVPLDTSGRSQRAPATADRLARALGAEIVLLTVLESEDGVSEEVSLVPRELGAGLCSSLRVRVEHGLPAKTILAAIDQEAPELVVMSSHGGNTANELALGSVAREVVASSPVPVTLVGQANATDLGRG